MNGWMLKHLSIVALQAAEKFFLYAHGWHKTTRKTGYKPPNQYPFRVKTDLYAHNHAVNAQKQLVYNPEHGGMYEEPAPGHTFS